MIARIIGTLAYYLFPIRRRIIMTNISRVFDNRIDAKGKIRLAKQFYSHMWRFFLELIQSICFPFLAKWRRLEVENLDKIRQGLDKGKGVFWLTCHLGNWETAFVEFMHQHPEYQGRVTLIRKRLRPAFLDKLIIRRFERAGVHILKPEKMAIRTVLKKLKQNEIVVFVLDQHASPHLATRAEFFGHTVHFSKGLARLAIHTEAPVIPTVTWRSKSGHHVVHFGDAIPCEHGDQAIQNTTQAYNRSLENYIRQHPEQWFCLAHRLWKVPKAQTLST